MTIATTDDAQPASLSLDGPPVLPARKDLAAQGKGLRGVCARGSHAEWSPPDDRMDPLKLLEESNQGRAPELIPIRYGRMLQSPFAFFRGAAAPNAMLRYAKLCGWALARAHARSGRPAVLAAYLGQSDRFDRAIADFAAAYADQNERDYAALQKAAREGRIDAHAETANAE
jgi:hypothetical protein